jgi:glycosyltransferase involved in cell wall biosynthesis
MDASSLSKPGPGTAAPKLSVVIATYNGEACLGRCLDSFTCQSLDPCLFEVIVVDNNSTDSTPLIAAEYAARCLNFMCMEEPRPGVSYARNAGISQARGDYICFIDDDAYADSRWLEEVLKAFETVKPAPVVVGGKILPYYVTEKPVWFPDSVEIRSQGEHARFLSEKHCRFGFSESNYCIRKKTLNEIGVFSTELGPQAEAMSFGEGVELSGRVAAKYPTFWYNPQQVVYHLVPERNMSIKYILSRKFKKAYTFQSYESPSVGIPQNMCILSICAGRACLNILLSIFWVRWFSKKAIADWLSHMDPLVSCSARCVYLIKYLLRLT